MDYAEELDNADSESYATLKSNMQKEIKKRASRSLEQAPTLVKTVIDNSITALCQEMEEANKAEEETIASSRIWSQFAGKYKKEIDKSLGDLDTLVGASAKTAEDNIKQKAEKMFYLAENIIANANAGIGYLKEEKARLVREEQKIKESMESIQSAMLALQQHSDRVRMTGGVKEQLVNMQKHGMDMLVNFNKIYAAAHKPEAKAKPSQLGRLFEMVTESLYNTQRDLELCVAIKKVVIQERVSETYRFIVSMAARIVKKANSYMSMMLKAVQKVYSRGKDLGDKLVCLKPIFTSVKPSQQEGKAKPEIQDTLAQCMVREMFKNGVEVNKLM